jgi:hypothetical protein
MRETPTTHPPAGNGLADPDLPITWADVEALPVTDRLRTLLEVYRRQASMPGVTEAVVAGRLPAAELGAQVLLCEVALTAVICEQLAYGLPGRIHAALVAGAHMADVSLAVDRSETDCATSWLEFANRHLRLDNSTWLVSAEQVDAVKARHPHLVWPAPGGDRRVTLR